MSIEKRLSVVKKRQGNLVRRLADTDDDDLVEIIDAELASLTKQSTALKAELAALHLERASWEHATAQLMNLTEWCDRVAANLDQLSYDDKRQLLFALGLQVRVFEKAHEPRWDIRLSVPIDNGAVAGTGTRRSTSTRRSTRS